jgi:vacuolar protein sorting-associated protein 13A/C
MREKTTASSNKICIQIEGPPWETCKGIVVDKEGTETYVLRPALNRVLHMLVCDVTMEEKVKVITLRSTMQVKNLTTVPVEIMLSKKKGASENNTNTVILQILPGSAFAVPIEAACSDLVYMRPLGFGYDWSAQGVSWRDIHQETLVCLLMCKSFDHGSPNFQFQLNSVLHSKDRFSLLTKGFIRI